MKPYAIVLLSLALHTPAFFAAENVTASDEPGNLLKNGSFESGTAEQGRAPDDWGFITESAQPVNGGMTNAAARTGEFAIYIDKPANEKDKWQVLAFGAAVEAGSTYEFSAWVKPDPQNPIRGDTKGVISIEWKDAQGKEIDRAASEPWSSKSFLASGDWTQFIIKGPAPKKAASATFVITYYAGSSKEAGSSFLVDDAVAKKITP